MSSKYVRDSILAFIASELPTEKLIDLTADFEDIQDLMASEGITMNDPWLGIQFIGSEEVPVDILSTNTKGRYREIGTIYIHVVEVARIGVHNPILVRAEAIRNKFRGQRINNDVIIEQVGPPSFGDGASLSFSSGYSSGTITLFYQRDLTL